MPIIKTVDPAEATGKVAAIYNTFTEKFGFVPNAFKLTSSSEFLIGMQAASIGYFMTQTALSFPFQAFVRMLVSMNHNCAYCVDMNTGMLLRSGFTIEQINAAKENPENVPFPEKEKALILFILKVIKDSNSTSEADMIALRELGWQDSEILEATYSGAMQVASDMIFNAFKIEND